MNMRDRRKVGVLPGRLLATYKLLPTFTYCEHLCCYVDNAEELDANIPPPHPPEKGKAEIFDLSKYSHVDERAVQAPSTLRKKSLKELVEYLIEGYEDDLSKIRVIYRWITCQSIDKLKLTKKEPSTSHAEYQLWRIKYKKGNYAQLVSLLCRYANIPCIIIHGILKGSTYEVGDELDSDVHYGEWNAVLVDGDWRFINAYWGTCAEGTADDDYQLIEESGNFDGKGELSGKLVFCCDENYFLTDPEQLGATHLPEVEEWQMVEDPIPADKFAEMAFIKDRFFNLRLELLSHPNCVVHSSSGDVEFRFGIPKDIALNLDFQYLLFRLHTDNTPTSQAAEQCLWTNRYDRYVFLQRMNNHEVLSIKVRSPVADTFRFEVVGKDITNQDPSYDYDWIVIYKIVFDGVMEGCSPFPEMPPIGWGPGRDAIECGLAPLSHFTGEFEVDERGKATIRFGAAKKGGLGKMKYHGKLFTGGTKQVLIPDRVVHRVENGDLIYHVQVPKRGEYCLKLFSKSEGVHGEGRNFCNYFITSKHRHKTDSFPRGFEERLGPKDSFKQLGLNPSHSSGYIYTEENEVQIFFQKTQPVDLFLNLSGGNVKLGEASHLVAMEEDDRLIAFTLRLPEPGTYGAKVRGAPKGEKHFGIYDYIIEYKKGTKRKLQDNQADVPLQQQKPQQQKQKQQKQQQQQEEEPQEPQHQQEDVSLPVVSEDVPTLLKQRILRGIEEQNIDTLEEAVKELKHLGLPSTKPDIEHAEEEIDILKIKKVLRNSEEVVTKLRKLAKVTKNRDVGGIKSALARVKECGYENRMPAEVASAKLMMERLKKIRKLMHAVLAMNQTTIAEIKAYNSPPAAVHRVMQATLLLLGHWEEETEDWKNIQLILGKIGKDSIKRLITEFDIDSVSLDVSLGARDLLRDFTIEQVRLVSAGGATFYFWVKGVTEEIEKRAGDEILHIRPRTSKKRRRTREKSTISLGETALHESDV